MRGLRLVQATGRYQDKETVATFAPIRLDEALT
jgi:hypothetical protein